MLPVYAAKAGGFFFIVFGVAAFMGGLLSINPVWKFGPYDPTKVTAGSQPDWYMGWPDGLLRIMPGWESVIFGYTISWNVMVPILIAPLVMWGLLTMLPFIDGWITKDKRDHHLLYRPRDAPTRTAVMVALMTFYGLAWAAGGNDIIAVKLHLSINQITYFMRVMVFLGPVIAFIIAKRWCISLQRHDRDKVLHGYETGIIMRSPEGGYSERHLPIIAFIITKRWCISLQRHDRDKLLHGYETGIIMRSAEGGYSERHLPISEEAAYTLTARDRDVVLSPAAAVDGNGVKARGTRVAAVRAALSTAMFADNIQKPTVEELEEGHHHAEHEHELESGLDHSADGHQFDGRPPVEEEHLRH
jgi:ubiquinol-cytochrome c reductase cytochrome b subunit